MNYTKLESVREGRGEGSTVQCAWIDYRQGLVGMVCCFLALALPLWAAELTLENDFRVEGNATVDGTIVVTPQGGIPMLSGGDLAQEEAIRVGVMAKTDPSSTFTLTASPSNALAFGVEDEDTHGAWDNNTFTAPFTDSYSVSATVSFEEGSTALGDVRVDLYVNNSLYRAGVLALSSANAIGNFSTRVNLNSGDTLQLRTNLSVNQVFAEPNHIDIYSFKASQATVTQTGVGSGGVPIGTVIVWMQESPPAGYLSCNGQALSRIEYPELYSVIGSSYGAGTTDEEFNLPDLRGYFLRGWDNGANNDPEAATRDPRGDGRSGFEWVGTQQDSEFESHTHTARTYARWPDNQSLFNDISDQEVNAWQRGAPVNNWNTSINVTDAEGGTETRPINIAVHYCIRYQ